MQSVAGVTGIFKNRLIITIFMQEYILEHIRRHVVGSGQAALLTGPQARNELINLYQTLSELKYKGLVEPNKDEIQFWTKFLGLVKGEDLSKSGLERDVAVAFVDISLKRLGGPYHLFLPDVDKMFYRYDIQNKGMMGASLRRIWSISERNLTIFGSVSDEKSRSYRKTIDKYEYPFWIYNWAPIRI